MNNKTNTNKKINPKIIVNKNDKNFKRILLKETIKPNTKKQPKKKEANNKPKNIIKKRKKQ